VRAASFFTLSKSMMEQLQSERRGCVPGARSNRRKTAGATRDTSHAILRSKNERLLGGESPKSGGAVSAPDSHSGKLAFALQWKITQFPLACTLADCFYWLVAFSFWPDESFPCKPNVATFEAGNFIEGMLITLRVIYESAFQSLTFKH
jgi:hypothetical protein